MKRLKGLLLLILLVLTIKVSFASQALASLYNQANHFYQKKDFSKAIELYEKVVKSGVSNSDLFYNLANAYYQEGELAKAVLYWWRAEKLSPRDPDVRYNLKLVNSRINQKLPAQSPPKASRYFHYIRDLASSKEWGILLSISIWAFWLFLCLRILFSSRRLAKVLNIVLGICLVAILFFSFCFGFRRHWERAPYAVVLEEHLKLRSGPGKDFSSILELPEGTRVLIKECRSGYCQVELGSGISGWVLGEKLEQI